MSNTVPNLLRIASASDSLRFAVFIFAVVLVSPARADTLEQWLLKENPAILGRDARQLGNPERGALFFHQPALGCARCHTSTDKEPLLGPDLVKSSRGAAEAYLVEAVLLPSKAIKQGFETVQIITTKGITHTGLLIEEDTNRVVLRDPAKEGPPTVLAKKEIEERSISKSSLMPSGLVNQLSDRQQFLDLVSYLIEITSKGPARARQLRPDPALVNPPLPSYEHELDHAGLIASLDQAAYQRGQAIYQQICASCHGTKDKVGSMPTALPFATGKFKNGSDPFLLYQTLTRGYGMMAAQTMLVPQQKYDVIHYVREAYLKPFNPDQYTHVDASYLARLPKGTSRGPAPAPGEPWRRMDYGPTLAATYEIGSDGSNFAYKAIAVRLDLGSGGIARGKAWMMFDHDTLRMAAGWTGEGFIDWNSVLFNGSHDTHPRTVGQVHFDTIGPGWANPETGTFDDPRLRGRDGKPYGPLPRSWAHYKGMYLAGDRVVFAYTVGDTAVLESPGLAGSVKEPIFTRTFNLGSRSREMILEVARPRGSASAVRAGTVPVQPGLELQSEHGHLRLRIPAGKTPLHFALWITPSNAVAYAERQVAAQQPTQDLTALTHGGKARWNQTLTTKPVLGHEDGPFAVDVLTYPEDNPWQCQMRLTGLDFLPDGKQMAVCSWDGDVWLVSGLDHPVQGLRWRRIASGLFQPLGLKIVDGKIYVGCRDQIAILHDLNGDGEIDFYENFNNDHQVTDHFHEFAMGLQTDAAGNFYYAKAARHAKTALVPQHGTLLRVSRDGLHTDILATGFRAPNGVCVNPDGTFFLTDQEGHWIPKNRINWVRPGHYYGNFWGYQNLTDKSDVAMEQPVCWITNRFDRSPSELVRVKSPAWGKLNGHLLNLSYGFGKIYVVMMEQNGDLMQGGMCPLPLPLFPTGIMRARFNPADGHLYTCGMYAWAGNQQKPGGLFRVRATGKPSYLPINIQAHANGIALTFTDPLDPQSVTDLSNYWITTWGLKRTANYGSQHYNEKALPVRSAKLSADGRTLFLEMPDLKPTWCMEIIYALKARDGRPVDGMIHNTIHWMGEKK